MLNKHSKDIPEKVFIPCKLVITKDHGNILYIGIPDSIVGDADYIHDIRVNKIVRTYGPI